MLWGDDKFCCGLRTRVKCKQSLCMSLNVRQYTLDSSDDYFLITMSTFQVFEFCAWEFFVSYDVTHLCFFVLIWALKPTSCRILRNFICNSEHLKETNMSNILNSIIQTFISIFVYIVKNMFYLHHLN